MGNSGARELLVMKLLDERRKNALKLQQYLQQQRQEQRERELAESEEQEQEQQEHHYPSTGYKPGNTIQFQQPHPDSQHEGGRMFRTVEFHPEVEEAGIFTCQANGLHL